MLDDAMNWVKGWLVAYAIVVVTAAVLAWPMMDKAATVALAIAFYFLTVAWLASFIHLASSSVPGTWWWLAVTVVLSFTSSVVSVIVADMPRQTALPAMLAFACVASVLAGYIAWRRKRDGLSSRGDR